MKLYNKINNAYYYGLVYTYKLMSKFKHTCSFRVGEGIDGKCKCGKSFREYSWDKKKKKAYINSIGSDYKK